MRATLEKLSSMKTSHSLWQIIDDGVTLLPHTGDHSSHIKNAILFEISDDREDGTYPRVSDYTRLANSIDREGPAVWVNRLTRKKNKLKIEFEGCTITREAAWQDEAVIEFKEPVEMLFAYIGETPVVRDIKKIKGEFTHDWFWTKNGRQEKIANGFEIWFNIHEYLE